MRGIAYIVGGLFCGGVLFLTRSFVFRDRWRHNNKIDLKELRRMDIEYGQKQDRDHRFKLSAEFAPEIVPRNQPGGEHRLAGVV